MYKRQALDRALIEAAIDPHRGDIAGCYQRIRQDHPELQGKVTVKIVIDKGGSVSKADLKSTTLNDADVEQCVIELLRKVRFPEPRGGGIVIMSYPVSFAPE